MRIKEDFKEVGHFWLPEKPQEVVSGILYVYDGGYIELELIGTVFKTLSLNGFDYNISRIDRIIGVMKNYGHVTLENCVILSGSFSMEGVARNVLKVSTALLGKIYESGEGLLINEYTFSVEGLDEWLSISGFNCKPEHDSDEVDYIVKYKRPKKITIELADGIRMAIWFASKYPIGKGLTEGTFKQQARITFESSDAKDLHYFLCLAYRLTTFLCLASGKTVAQESVVVKSDKHLEKIDDGLVKKDIYTYFQSRPFSSKEPECKWFKMLFRYSNVEDKLEKVINNWFNAYEKLNPSLNLYFVNKSSEVLSWNNKFLSYVHSLETLHRRTSDEVFLDKDEYKQLVDEIVLKCPDEYQEWLSKKLTFGNEISLAGRLKSLSKPFGVLFDSKKELKKFIRKVVDTRNYLTHYDESLEEKAIDGIDLWHLLKKLETLLQVHFLKILGFSDSEAIELVSNQQ